MSRPRRPSVQECRKRFDGKCFFHSICGNDSYVVLDAHRILEGCHGGKYHWQNILSLCAVCHRRVSAGEFKIHRRYQSSAGPVVHWTDADGSEHYTKEEPFGEV